MKQNGGFHHHAEGFDSGKMDMDLDLNMEMPDCMIHGNSHADNLDIRMTRGKTSKMMETRVVFPWKNDLQRVGCYIFLRLQEGKHQVKGC